MSLTVLEICMNANSPHFVRLLFLLIRAKWHYSCGVMHQCCCSRKMLEADTDLMLHGI